MKYVRWLIAWLLYLIGDAVSKVLNRIERWERLSVGLCNVYQWTMVRSHLIQGPGDFGPWRGADS